MNLSKAVHLRRENIVALVNENGYITIEELSNLLDVTTATLRVDLEDLSKEKRLIRLRGVAISNMFSRSNLQRPKEYQDFRAISHGISLAEEKKKIGKLCINMFLDNDTIYLDSSNTNFHLAEQLVAENSKSVSVVTNSIDIFNMLKFGTNINAILTGGDYDKTTNSLVGNIAEQMLESFKAHFSFVTARGFDEKIGVMLFHSSNTPIRKAMMKNSNKKVVVADHSKFTSFGIEPLCHWDDFDILVTSKEPPEPFDSILRTSGIEVIYPK